MKIPSFRWANGAEVWNCMLEKDATYSKLRSEKLLQRHPSLVHSYRTILFDWLSEVSHECKFHRETYHLALDFIDRYLAATSNVGKFQLQLIGTTCLFLAAKYEEIRPPTVIEFAELTDGACKAEDIVDNEIVILSALGWNITPMTPNNWLNIYMQILHNPNQVDGDTNGAQSSDKSTIPIASKCLHKRVASVIDLALLHIDSLRFRNSILAAAAIRHFTHEQCSSFTSRELAECYRWLEPFVEVINSVQEPVYMASCRGDHPTQMHTHIATAGLLERVLTLMGARRHLEATASLKRKAYCLEDDTEEEEQDDEEVDQRVRQMVEQHKRAKLMEQSRQESQVTSTTVLLTPPSSTSKARKQSKRHHNHHLCSTTSSHLYQHQGSECSPPPALLQQQQQRQPFALQQHQPLPTPLPQLPKGGPHAHCRGEKISA